MAAISDLDLIDKCNRRRASMSAQYGGWRNDYVEVSRFLAPRTSPALLRDKDGEAMTSKGKGQLNNKLLDAHGVWAHGVLTAGMYSGLSSPSTPWFKLGTNDPEMMTYQPVKLWLDDTVERISSLLSRTNFYQVMRSGYGELALFGTEASLMVEHWKYGAVVHPMTAGEYMIAQDDGLRVDTLYRDVWMTIDQIVGRFGLDKLPQRLRTKWNGSEKDYAVAVRHMIEPNLEREGDKIDRTNKAYRSVYWLADGKEPLAFEGFDECPFWSPRWDTLGGDAYGASPAMYALADAKGLQLQALRKQQAIDYTIKPSLRGPATLANTFANLVPGGITTMASIDKDVFGPIWEVPPQALPALREDIALTRQSVERFFYTDVLLAVTNMAGVQPRNIEELARRNEEKLVQLGPVTDRVQTEKLAVAIDRAFAILHRTGQLLPAPPELQGTPLKLEFISVLAQAQRMIGIGNIERFLSFTGNLIGVFPQVANKVNVLAAMDEYGSRLGIPAKIVNSDEEVAKIEEGQAQAEQAQQMAAMAPAAADAAKAAQLLSETDRGDGSSMLAGLTGMAA